GSRALDKAIDHALLPRLVECHGELVDVDRHDAAVADFQMEHAVAQRMCGRDAGRAGNERALDRHWPMAQPALHLLSGANSVSGTVFLEFVRVAFSLFLVRLGA